MEYKRAIKPIIPLLLCHRFLYSGAMFNTYIKRHITGLHYAVRIFLGTSILWLVLHNEQTSDSLWAIISLIVVTEPQAKPAWMAFRARMINTVIGCAVGLGFVLMPVSQVWALPPAITTSALIATYANRAQQGWRVAPVTTGLIMSAGMLNHTTHEMFSLALHRTGEVFLGSISAVMIAVVMSYVWRPDPAADPKAKR